ncbi:MAG TPA: glycosyltransferase family 4 protein, partial [Blastocatellia bacterium]|nr:glycosyltransferase family 4 protein [Blastocatellia bacterium]
MRIAQVSPLYESVPPKLYGGTERVVAFLTEELVRQGHEVTLYASGDSITSANLVACSPRSLRLDESCVDPIARHFTMLERVFGEAEQYDIIHFHIDYLHFPLSRRARIRQLSTLHGRLDIPDLAPLYREYRDMPLVSISDAQRAPLSWANWKRTIYHGLPHDLFRLEERPGDYLAFLGRVSHEKRPDRAIEIARRAGMKLKMAAKVDKPDREYFNAEVKPRLGHPLVEFVGEIGELEKQEFLGNARALLFPIDWPEPFGLVMIEAMACGTPVIAYPCGSVPEIIQDGVSGFIADSVPELVEAVKR